MNSASQRLQPVDSLTIDVITDDVSDAYITKTLFAVSEFANIVKGGAKEPTQGGFGEAAGIGVGLVEQAADFSEGEADREFFHPGKYVYSLKGGG